MNNLEWAEAAIRGSALKHGTDRFLTVIEDEECQIYAVRTGQDNELVLTLKSGFGKGGLKRGPHTSAAGAIQALTADETPEAQNAFLSFLGRLKDFCNQESAACEIDVEIVGTSLMAAACAQLTHSDFSPDEIIGLVEQTLDSLTAQNLA